MRWHVAVAFILLCSSATAARGSADAIVPTDADRAGYELGNANARMVNVFFDPAVCGIVLERERCRTDFELVRSASNGPEESTDVRAFFATGDPRAFHRDAWHALFMHEIPDAAWHDNPRGTWLFIAGSDSVYSRFPASGRPPFFDGDVLWQRAAEAGPYGTLVAGSPHDVAVLGSQLDDIFAVHEFPVANVASDTRGDARLGVFVSTINELFERPAAVCLPQSRAFVRAVLARLQHPDESKETIAAIQRLQTAFLPTAKLSKDDLAALRRDFASVSGPAAKDTFHDGHAWVLGLYAAQAAYNAAVLQDPEADRNFRGVLRTLTPSAELGSAVNNAWTDLSAVPARPDASWATIGAAATQLTLAILHS